MEEDLIPIIQEMPTKKSMTLTFVFDPLRNVFIPLERIAEKREEISYGMFKLFIPRKKLQNRIALNIGITKRNKVYLHVSKIREIFDEKGNIRKNAPLIVFKNRKELYEWFHQNNFRIEGWPWELKKKQFKEIFIDD